MRYLSYVGLGLSVVFGCLFLALVAELYYLLCRKKKKKQLASIGIEVGSGARGFLYMSCWKKPSSLCSSPQTLGSSLRIPETHQTHDPELVSKPLEEEGLNQQHYFSGLPRCLFTIKEETKEDLESEDGSRKSRSFGELVAEGPFWTPPHYTTPPFTPKCKLGAVSPNRFNPLFESSTESEVSGLRQSLSPPPRFKFLKDAEEKLQRRKMGERAARERRVTEAPAASTAVEDKKDEDGWLACAAAANTSKETELSGQPSSSQLLLNKTTKKKFALHLTSVP